MTEMVSVSHLEHDQSCTQAQPGAEGATRAQETDGFRWLKAVFRELFQLDIADLDFGLYRLFRLKRAEVEAFLDTQLPAAIDQAFATLTQAQREALQERVDELARQAQANVADDALLPSGEPNPTYAQTKAVEEYTEARKQLQAVEVSEAQRAEVFNLLYAFFSRYYDDGDFIPRRFFGARPSYAVPYNGEEVFFHCLVPRGGSADDASRDPTPTSLDSRSPSPLSLASWDGDNRCTRWLVTIPPLPDQPNRAPRALPMGQDYPAGAAS